MTVLKGNTAAGKSQCCKNVASPLYKKMLQEKRKKSRTWSWRLRKMEAFLLYINSGHNQNIVGSKLGGNLKAKYFVKLHFDFFIYI